MQTFIQFLILTISLYFLIGAIFDTRLHMIHLFLWAAPYPFFMLLYPLLSSQALLLLCAYLFSVAWCILIPCHLLKKHIKDILYIIFLYFSLSLCISGFILLLYYLTGNTSVHKPVVEIIVDFSLLLLSFLLYITSFAKKFHALMSMLSIPAKVLTLLLLTGTGFLILLSNGIIERNYNPSWIRALFPLIIIMTLLIMVCGILLLFLSIRDNRLRLLADLYRAQISAQIEHYTKMAESRQELRRFRHDYQNLNTGLIALLKKGDTTSALTLLNDCGKQIDITQESFFYQSGNTLLDALLAAKAKTAACNHGSITFDGAFPSSLFSPMDVCVIFGVTLDNALEACATLKAPYVIRVISRQIKGNMYVCVENPVTAPAVIKNNKIKTTKTDSANHGIGLYSLSKTLKPLGGIYTLSCSEQLFMIQITLPVQNYTSKLTPVSDGFSSSNL